MNIRFFFVLMLIARSGGVVLAEDSATESVEMRADVPSSVGITILKGQNGLDLFDEQGVTKRNAEDRTIKFKLNGNFFKAQLSFSGTDGLSWQSGDSNSRGWSISHASGAYKLGILLSLSGVGQESDPKAIGNGEEIHIDHTDRDKEMAIVVVPKSDVNTSPLAAGRYRGKLNITLKAAD